MALIICPECGKEISDKAIQCINCGFPLQEIENTYVSHTNTCKINGDEYDLSRVIESVRNNKNDFKQKEAHKILADITGLSSPDRGRLLYIILKNDKIPQSYNSGDFKKPVDNGTPKSCPKCGSTEFTPLRKKFSLLTGFATNKVDMVCSKCGYVRK